MRFLDKEGVDIKKANMTMDELLTKEYNRHRFRWLKWSVSILTLLILTVGITGYEAFNYYAKNTPSLNTVFKSAKVVQSHLQQGSIKYLDSNGHQFYEAKSVSYQPISSYDVKHATNVTKALIATEDRNFYHEHGVNWRRTIKAGVNTYLGHGVSGGSTITQQLIKLSYFSTKRSDQTIKRKIQEIVLAQRLAKRYSKLQILTWYLNRVNYGNGQQGIVAASHYYYDKTPRQLTKLEAATLTGIVNSPTMYNPYVYPKLMQKRRNVVLASMYAMKFITKDQFKRWSKIPVSKTLVSVRVHQARINNDLDTRIKYDGIITAADQQLKQYHLQNRNRDLVIKTSLNQKLQNQVNRAVAKQNYASPKLQEALVVFNNQNGNVSALSSGRDRSSVGGYNRATDLNRSSGSSIKPLLDYGPGFDMYGWQGDNFVYDTPFAYPGTNMVVHDWDNGYQGQISLSQALVQSRNIPAVKALQQVGLANGRKVLKALGLYQGSLFYPNAIGVNTSPLKMASAYSSLADEGYRVNPRFVSQVKNLNNHQIVKTNPVFERVYSKQTAYHLNHILQNVFDGNGTATNAKISGSNQAGKTGTVGRSNYSNALTDGWMIGYTKSYTVAVWVGYDNPYSSQILTNNDAYVAQYLYKDVMKHVMKLSNNTNSNWQFVSSSRSDDFRLKSNRVNAKLPFYLTNSPGKFLQQRRYHNLDAIYNEIR